MAQIKPQPYGDFAPPDIYWNADSSSQLLPQRGYYAAITGNTGSGKSTLISHIATMLKKKYPHVVAINERILHHPLLKLMFSNPKEYAFGVQLNFLLQRHLCLYRWLSLGYIVLIERSHLDDILFVDNHLEMGHITEQEFDAYVQLSRILFARIPDPHLVAFLDADPEISIKRISEAENSGERPYEFPDEETKRQFVYNWHGKYSAHVKFLKQKKDNQTGCIHTTFLELNAGDPVSNSSKQVMSEILRALKCDIGDL